MGLDGVDRDIQFGSYLVVGQAAGEVAQDGAFAVGERVDERTLCLVRRRRHAGCAVQQIECERRGSGAALEALCEQWSKMFFGEERPAKGPWRGGAQRILESAQRLVWRAQQISD